MALYKKMVRTILAHKAQFFGALFMVLLGSMLFVGMNLVATNLDQLFRSFSTQNQLGDAEFFTNSELDIPSLAEKFDANFEKSSYVDYVLNPGQILRIFSKNDVVNIPAILEGKMPQDGEIAIDKLFAAANNISLGSTLRIEGKDFKVVGLTTLPNYIYIIQSKEEMINDPTAFGIAVLPKEEINRLPGNTIFYAVRFNQRENIHTQENALKNEILSSGVVIQNWVSTETNVRVSYVELEVLTLTTMSRALPIAVLFLSSVLIAIMIKRIIQQETVVIGTLYAQGYRKNELLGHYLLLPLSISVFGSGIGVILGLVITKPMLNFMLMFLIMPLESINYSLTYVVFALFIPVIILCGTAYFVIIKILHKTPADLMKGSWQSEQLNFVERRLTLNRFPFKTKFVIREQVRSLSRSVFLVFGVIAATVLLLYGLTLQNSLDFMLTHGIQSLYNLKYEVVFNTLNTEEPPTGWEPFNAIYGSLDDESSTYFYVVGVIPDTSRMVLENMAGERLTVNQTIITRQLAEKLNVNPRDSITLVNEEDLQTYTFTIDEIANSFAGEFVFVPMERLNTMLGVPANAYSGIWGDEQLNFPEGQVKSTKSIETIIAGINNLINQTGVMVYMLTVSSFVIGLIILFIVTGMVIEENKQTISLFKILGYDKKEINRLILNSNLALVVIGYLIGVPVLLVSVSALIQSLTESMQMTIPVRLNPVFMILGFFVILISFETAKLISKKKINRIPIHEALKAGTE